MDGCRGQLSMSGNKCLCATAYGDCTILASRTVEGLGIPR
jgi:hypothetical protein